jgi:hypothetical protein
VYEISTIVCEISTIVEEDEEDGVDGGDTWVFPEW